MRIKSGTRSVVGVCLGVPYASKKEDVIIYTVETLLSNDS